MPDTGAGCGSGAAISFAALPDYELLELMLARSIPRGDVKPIAKALLRRFGDLTGVFSATLEELKTVAGVGAAVALDLKLVHEATARLNRARASRRPVISTWSALLDYVKVAMAGASREQFRVLFLDKRNQLIADEVMNHGTIDHAPVYPREVVRRAIELSASAVILAHNHPSGDPTPSASRHRHDPSGDRGRTNPCASRSTTTSWWDARASPASRPWA